MKDRRNWKGRSVVALAIIAVLGWAGFAWQKHTTAQDSTGAKHAGVDSATREHARGLSKAFRAAAEMALPTVVTIESTTNAKAPNVNPRGNDEGNDNGGPRSRGENPFKGTPWEDLFDNPNSPFGRGFDFDGRGFGGAPRREGMGSGVIIDSSGIILTNNHVVEGADKVLVRLHDGQEFEARDIKVDKETDLAVLRIASDGSLPAAHLGNSDDLEIGDWVIAVGNPLGWDSTVSAGIISGKGRELGANQRRNFLQTDAAINPGNSGGPLLNLDGEVIGINTAIATNNGGYQGIGFAIPSNLVKWVMSQLIEHGSVNRAYLGVSIAEVNAKLARQLGVRRGEGVVVGEVLPGTPAAEAGLQELDVITAFAGHAVHKPRDLQEMVERAPFDSKQALTVLRDGKSMELEVVVKPLPSKPETLAAERPSEDGTPGQAVVSNDSIGLSVSDLTEAERTKWQGIKGVMIRTITEGSPAEEVGLREGMIILKVGKQKVENLEQFQDAVSKVSVENGVLLLVRTEAGTRVVVIERRR